MSVIYEKAKEFSMKYILPEASNIDDKAEFPSEIFEKLGQEGFLRLLIPKQYGGQGLGVKEHVEVCMALAEGSASVALSYMMHNVVANALNKIGTNEQKEVVFKDCVEKNEFYALAISEAKSGVNTNIPTTRSVKLDEVFYLINGEKSMVTSGGFAKYNLLNIFDEDLNENVYWLISKDLVGVTFQSNLWNGLGMRGNVSSPMTMSDVKVSKNYYCGTVREGDADNDLTTTYFVLGLAAVYSGLTISIKDAAIEHSINRIYPDGTNLAGIDTIKIHLSKLYCLANSAEKVTLAAADARAQEMEDASEQLISSRIIAIESAMEAAKYAMRIGGGKAYNKYSPIERLLRDSYAGQIMIPSVDSLNLTLGDLVATNN